MYKGSMMKNKGFIKYISVALSIVLVCVFTLTVSLITKYNQYTPDTYAESRVEDLINDNYQDYLGDGSIRNPFQIGTAKQLFSFRYDFMNKKRNFKDVSRNYPKQEWNAVQTADIFATKFGDEVCLWEPIGNNEIPYTNIFDGQGYKFELGTVYGDSTKNSEVLYGLFGCVTGTVKNVFVNTITISIDNQDNINCSSMDNKSVCVGVISATTNNAKIQSCYVEKAKINIGNIKNTIFAGCMVGYANGGTEINSCYSKKATELVINTISKKGTVEEDGDVYCGGIVGYCNSSKSIINLCHNEALVSITENTANFHFDYTKFKHPDSPELYNIASTNTKYLGGIAGYSCGSIKLCENDNELTAYGYNDIVYAGGIVGALPINDVEPGMTWSRIEKCANQSKIQAGNDFSYKVGLYGKEVNYPLLWGYKSYAGGIAGYAEGYIENCYNIGSIEGYAKETKGEIKTLTPEEHKVRQVINIDNIYTYAYTGGIVGYAGDYRVRDLNGDGRHDENKSQIVSIISNSYNTGTVSSRGAWVEHTPLHNELEFADHKTIFDGPYPYYDYGTESWITNREFFGGICGEGYYFDNNVLKETFSIQNCFSTATFDDYVWYNVDYYLTRYASGENDSVHNIKYSNVKSNFKFSTTTNFNSDGSTSGTPITNNLSNDAVTEFTNKDHYIDNHACYDPYVVEKGNDDYLIDRINKTFTNIYQSGDSRFISIGIELHIKDNIVLRTALIIGAVVGGTLLAIGTAGTTAVVCGAGTAVMVGALMEKRNDCINSEIAKAKIQTDSTSEEHVISKTKAQLKSEDLTNTLNLSTSTWGRNSAKNNGFPFIKGFTWGN